MFKKVLETEVYHALHLNDPLLSAALCRLFRVEFGPDMKV